MNKQAVNQVFENSSMEVARKALGKSIARWTDKGDQHVTAIPGLSLVRRDEPSPPTSIMYEPRICLVAQGAKRVLLGDDTYVYDAHHFLITYVALPTVVQKLLKPEQKTSRQKQYAISLTCKNHFLLCIIIHACYRPWTVFA